jgi:hypothetical protein
MEPKRQRQLALGACGLLVLVILYRILAPASPHSSSDAVQGGQQATAAAARGSKTPSEPALTEVNLSALNPRRPEPEDTIRNPFRFKPKPPPPPPPSAAMHPAGPEAVLPAGPPPPPRIALKFIGTFESPGKGVVANLKDDRGIYRGVVGDTIEGRYRIMKIGVESIDLAYLDGSGRQTIRLSGQ